MRRYVVLLVLLGGAAFAGDEPKKDVKLTKKDIGKMMKDAHRGDKSPQSRVTAELKKDAPDWAQLTKDAKAFTDMGAAFKNVELNYSSPTQYIEGAAALTKATTGKDKKAATDAFVALNKSCIACHSYGGIGGALK